MTSSDLTSLTPGAVESLSGRVGTLISGDPRSGGVGRIAILCAKFNGGITLRLLDGALAALADHGIDPASVTVVWVPGAFELPIAALQLATEGGVDAIISLGAVIRGDTSHFEYVAGPCATGLQRVALDTGVPVVFGVLTTENVEQALERSEADATNKGYEAAVTALEMTDLSSRLRPAVTKGR